jgi:hypothetical protein
MATRKDDGSYTVHETQRRAETALRAAFATPSKPQSEMKLGKRRSTKLGATKNKSKASRRTPQPR